MAEKKSTEMILNDCWEVDLGSGFHKCPVNCEFCYLKGSGVEIMYDTPFRTVSEVDKIVQEGYEKNKTNFVVGTNPEVDVLAHPYIYEILDMMGSKYPKGLFYICTTGVLADLKKLDVFFKHKNIIILLSVHTLHNEYRERIAPINRLDTIKVLLKGMGNMGLALIEPFWSLDVYKKDIEEIRKCGFSGVINTRRLEHSRYSTDKGKEMSIASCNIFEEAVYYSYSTDPKIGMCPTIPSIEIENPKHRYYNEMMSLQETITKDVSTFSGKKLFISSLIAFPFWKNVFKDDDSVVVDRMENSLYGGSYSVAGLSCKKDVYTTVARYDDINQFDHILLPAGMKPLMIENKVKGLLKSCHPADTYDDFKFIGKTPIHFLGQQSVAFF